MSDRYKQWWQFRVTDTHLNRSMTIGACCRRMNELEVAWDRQMEVDAARIEKVISLRAEKQALRETVEELHTKIDELEKREKSLFLDRSANFTLRQRVMELEFSHRKIAGSLIEIAENIADSLPECAEERKNDSSDSRSAANEAMSALQAGVARTYSEI